MGQHEYRLKSLADDELLAGLSRIVGRRNQITAEFLAYLAELDERQIFLDLGFASLFEYCVEALGLCESTAGRHIAAARVCRSHPQVFGMVASGALHASALSLLRKHLTVENAGELFELCRRKSARKVEELLAARFPRPDVCDLVRRLPAGGGCTLDVGCTAEEASTQTSPREPIELSQTSIESRQPELVELSQTDLEARRPELVELSQTDLEARQREPWAASALAGGQKPRRLEPLSADRYGVRFTVDGEFRELLERVRGLAGHRLPSGDLMTLFKRGLEAYERELSKERFALGRKPRQSRGVAPVSTVPCAPSAASAPSVTSAPSVASAASAPSVASAASAPSVASAPYLPKLELSKPDPLTPDPWPESSSSSNRKRRRRYSAAVARAVFIRDGEQCSYVSREGRRCSARWCLELDHVDPWAVGGEGTIDNLRLRCRAHNQRYARQYFGTSRVEAAVRHSRERRAVAERPRKAEQP